VSGATPAGRAAAACQALGRAQFTRWCAGVLSGACGMDELFDGHGPDPRWLIDPAWAEWDSAATWTERGFDYWPRVWAARSLLHEWDPVAAGAVCAGLDDPHWRVREMCAKVAARHQVADCAGACARLASSDSVPRVRAAALRALAITGEAEHAPAVAAALRDADPAVAGRAAQARTALERRLERSFEDLLSS
jgi:HEAT repeats